MSAFGGKADIAGGNRPPIARPLVPLNPLRGGVPETDAETSAASVSFYGCRASKGILLEPLPTDDCQAPIDSVP